jgi:hypothetical protein
MNLLTPLESEQKVGLRDRELLPVDRMPEEILRDLEDLAYGMRYFGASAEWHHIQEAASLLAWTLNMQRQLEHQIEVLTDQGEDEERRACERATEAAERRSTFKVVT